MRLLRTSSMRSRRCEFGSTHQSQESETTGSVVLTHSVQPASETGTQHSSSSVNTSSSRADITCLKSREARTVRDVRIYPSGQRELLARPTEATDIIPLDCTNPCSWAALAKMTVCNKGQGGRHDAHSLWGTTS